jgi:hypothetical protein
MTTTNIVHFPKKSTDGIDPNELIGPHPARRFSMTELHFDFPATITVTPRWDKPETIEILIPAGDYLKFVHLECGTVTIQPPATEEFPGPPVDCDRYCRDRMLTGYEGVFAEYEVAPDPGYDRDLRSKMAAAFDERAGAERRRRMAA